MPGVLPVLMAPGPVRVVPGRLLAAGFDFEYHQWPGRS